MLLVLDNFEHLLDSVDLLADLLAAAPGVKLLVTSRMRLNLREEWLAPLEGLELPPDADDVPSRATWHATAPRTCFCTPPAGFALASHRPRMRLPSSPTSAGCWRASRWGLSWPRHGRGHWR